jgi:hypothetical protein
MRRDLAVQYAGHWGEVLYFGHGVMHRSGADAREIRVLLDRLPEEQRAQAADRAVTRARETLKKEWAAVEWVARMLEQAQDAQCGIRGRVASRQHRARRTDAVRPAGDRSCPYGS